MPDLAHPLVLLLLPLLALVWRGIRGPVPSLLQALPGDWKQGRRKARAGGAFARIVRVAAMAVLVVALAGPEVKKPPLPGEGIAILFALDVSGSMEARDLGLATRLDLARTEVAEFSRRRSGDLLGLVTFGEAGVTLVPPTSDHGFLLRALSRVKVAADENGTAMGVGLGLATQRVAAAPAPSRVVVLLTDGRNNTGAMEPISVARAAAALGIRIHVVGVGGTSGADPLDEDLLRAVAREGGGRYFRVRDEAGFATVMEALDELERGPIPSAAALTRESRHGGVLLLGMALLLAEAILWLLPGGRIL